MGAINGILIGVYAVVTLCLTGYLCVINSTGTFSQLACWEIFHDFNFFESFFLNTTSLSVKQFGYRSLTDVLSGLIWIPTSLKGYKQTTLADKELISHSLLHLFVLSETEVIERKNY